MRQQLSRISWQLVTLRSPSGLPSAQTLLTFRRAVPWLVSSGISVLTGSMGDEELVDYKADPTPHHDIWAHSNQTSMKPQRIELASETAGPSQHPHLPLSGRKKPSDYHLDDTSTLECPPLSPSTLHLLGNCLQTSHSFDSPLLKPSCPALPIPPPPLPPSTSLPPSISLMLLNPWVPLRPPCTLLPGNSSTGPRSPIRSGCFNTPLLPVRSVGSAQHSSSDPCRRLLKDLPFGKRTEKLKKGKCLRVIDLDFNITFGEEAQLPDIMETAQKFLVGRVKGCTYTVDRLKLWTEEIWGTLLKELPEIRVLARG